MRYVVSAVAVALLVNPASGQSTAWANKLFGKDIEHDFGVVPRGAQLKYTFKMKNIYKVPLTVTNVRTTCGCLTWNIVKDTLQPNEEGAIEINMDGRRFSGFKKIDLYITVGPDYISTATLTLRANARQDVVFNPGDVDFGLVSPGQAPTKTIDVEYAGTLDWRITEAVKNAGAPFNLEVKEFQREGTQIRKVGYRLTVTLKADAPSGPFRQDLILKTNDPASPVLTVAVGGNVQATLAVAPGVVTLGSVKAGDIFTRKVLVKGSRPFRITAVEGVGDGITADFPDRVASTQIVTIRVQPEVSGDLRKQLLIRTDLDRETVTVSIEGTVTKE
jgi:hypothetical protein